jgi:hypothetical protein
MQPLAFPRIARYSLNKENKKQYRDFLWATHSDNLTKIVDGGELEISDNKIYDRTSSADAFYFPWYRENLVIGQVIKQVGLSASTYLTVNNIDPDGEYVEIKEDISNESAPSGGVDIYTTPLFGFDDDVGRAQTELALQGINETMFQKEIGEMNEPQPRKLELGGTLSVWYSEALSGQSKFGRDKSSPIDIVYYYLSPWLGISGRLV